MGDKRLRPAEIAMIAMVLTSLALSIYYYPLLPETMESFAVDDHIMIQGYDSRLMPTFAVSGVLAVILLPYLIIPRIRRKEIDERFVYYDRLVIVIFAIYFLAQIHQFITGFLEPSFHLLQIFGYSIGGIFLFLIGDTLSHAKQGWLISINTKRIHSHPTIWNETHHKTGKWIKRSSLFFILSGISPHCLIYYLASFLGGVCMFVSYFYALINPLLLGRKLDKGSAGNEASPSDSNQAI